MRLGLTDMVGLAASLIFAIPLANYAVIRLFAGEVALGVAMLVVAVAMVVLPQYFLDPGRILRKLLAGLLPRQLRELLVLDPAATESPDGSSPEGPSNGDEPIELPPEDAVEAAGGDADAAKVEK